VIAGLTASTDEVEGDLQENRWEFGGTAGTLTHDRDSAEEEPGHTEPNERRPVSRATLTHSRPAPADALDEPSHTPAAHGQDVAARAIARLRRDDALAQFARFVLVGATSTAVYALLFLSLRNLGYLTAHIVATVASSMLANELHRRLTFHAEERVGWVTAQLEAGGVSLFGLAATSTALGWLDSAAGSAHPFLQITLVAAVTALIGLMRFVALRWIFRPTSARAA
jgi:putative flippase GtrA